MSLPKDENGAKLKVLNLYAGIGGNRRLWENVEVTAVEKDPRIAQVYQDHFPEDTVIVGDAHQYLLDHYQDFDFIWSSPPCPTHSRFNFSNGGRWKHKYPDMRLYQEIIHLQHWFEGKWVVENVISYYDPLIPPQRSGRHYFWANFTIPTKDYGVQIGTLMHGTRKRTIREAQLPELQSLHEFDLSPYNLPNKRQILRNCVIPKLGLDVFEAAYGKQQKVLTEEFA